MALPYGQVRMWALTIDVTSWSVACAHSKVQARTKLFCMTVVWTDADARRRRVVPRWLLLSRLPALPSLPSFLVF